MHILKKLGLWLGLFIFSSAISVFTFSFIAVQTVGNPETVKSWFTGADTYNNFIDVAIDEIEIDTEEGEQSLVNEEVIKNSLQASFEGEQVQTWVESVLDGFYAWLNKEADKPEFAIDLSENVDQFIDAFASNVEAEYLQLPECQTINEARAVEADPLNANCTVPGVDIGELKDRLTEDIRGEDGLFEELEFNQDDLKIDPEGGGLAGVFNSKEDDSTEAEKAERDARLIPIYEKYDSLPDYFGQIKQVPLFAALAAVLAAAPIVFLASSKRAGARKIGWRLVTSAIVSIIGAILLFFGLRVLTGVSSTENSDIVKDLAAPLVQEIFTDFIIYSVAIAVVLMVVGVVLVVIFKKSKDMHPNSKLDKKHFSKPVDKV